MNGEKKNLNSVGAIYKINSHTKTASNLEKLYFLKNAVINKLLVENKAKKLLHPEENINRLNGLSRNDNFSAATLTREYSF